MKLGNLFVNKEGKLTKPVEDESKVFEEEKTEPVKEETKEESTQTVDTTTKEEPAEPNPKEYSSEEELPEDVYRITVYVDGRDVVYDVVGIDNLKQHLESIEESYIDDNIELLKVPQHLIVKHYIKGWSYGRVSEPEDYEAGDDE